MDVIKRDIEQIYYLKMVADMKPYTILNEY